MRDLLAALDRLRMRAARGTGKPRVPLRDLASATGVPRSSLANYLSGATLMPADVLDAVVLALGASPAEAREWANAWEAASAERFRGPGGSGGGGGSGGASTGGSGTGRGAEPEPVALPPPRDRVSSRPTSWPSPAARRSSSVSTSCPRSAAAPR
ncbi:helix-turn-helix domain-containing protein [Catenulispora yoronensis]